jgi:hypothetical protein
MRVFRALVRCNSRVCCLRRPGSAYARPRAVARERNVAQVQARLQAGVTRARASATPRKYGRP